MVDLRASAPLAPNTREKWNIDTIRELFALFNGFEALSCDDIWWCTDGKYAPITVFLNCNDTFFWGCSDCEEITPSDFPALRKAVDDVTAARAGLEKRHEKVPYEAGELFVARKRGMRPQTASYKECYHPATWPLFDAAGPERADPDGKSKPNPAASDVVKRGEERDKLERERDEARGLLRECRLRFVMIAQLTDTQATGNEQSVYQIASNMRARIDTHLSGEKE